MIGLNDLGRSIHKQRYLRIQTQTIHIFWFDFLNCLNKIQLNLIKFIILWVGY